MAKAFSTTAKRKTGSGEESGESVVVLQSVGKIVNLTIMENEKAVRRLEIDLDVWAKLQKNIGL